MKKNNVTKYISLFCMALVAFFLITILFLQNPDIGVTKAQAETVTAPIKTKETQVKKTAVKKVIDKINNPKSDIKEAKLFDIYAATTERALGDSKAPITVIEYASMTCPHCAKFHSETFPEVKKQYIETGKVYWIFREFPLDKLALRASMMARCVSPSMYFNLIEVLFTSQSNWLGSDSPLKAMERTGRLAGMTAEAFEECTNNTELEMHVLKNMQTGQNQWSVKSTPTFVINYGEEQMGGARTIEEFQEIFDRLLQKHGVE